MAKESAEKTTEKKAKKKSPLRGAKKKLEEKINELEIQLAETKDKHLRLFAEFENFKKRNIKERIELRKTAAEETLHSLLPVLDDFDRAKKSADSDDTSEQFSEGVELVYNKIHSTLASVGLKAMETNGEVFDPELHSAITEIPAPTEEAKGTIIDTIEKGYILNEKIIRHAKVVVGK